MSAMKKFSDSSGRMPLELGSRFRLGSDHRDNGVFQEEALATG
jgi:hypothetical protein